MNVRPLTHPTPAELDALADVLVDCVAGGASVSFMQPFGHADALAFWRRMAESAARGERVLLVAEDAALGIVGTVSVVLDMPPNQPHRADVAKMLVHRRARCRGVGAALMAAAETAAADAGRTLLVLDTASDAARRLYERAGWIRCGTIPGYALLPAGGLCDTTYYYRELSQRSRSSRQATSSESVAHTLPNNQPPSTSVAQ